jgi:uncharacterized protein RhaS with RHS repeats
MCCLTGRVVCGLSPTSSGTVTDTYRYDAYGNVTSSQGTTINPYRYDAQRLDALSGLYQLRARNYDPATGRFLR